MSTKTKTPMAPAVAPKNAEVATPDQTSVPLLRLDVITRCTDAALKDALKLLREEAKRRDEIAESARPQRGDRVIITEAGRFLGREGTVIISRKTRCFVDVDGFKQPAYLLHSDVQKKAKA